MKYSLILAFAIGLALMVLIDQTQAGIYDDEQIYQDPTYKQTHYKIEKVPAYRVVPITTTFNRKVIKRVKYDQLAPQRTFLKKIVY